MYNFTNKEDIKQGKIVRLKSGSPKLTVVSVEGENVLVCWFDVKDNYNSKKINIDLLCDENNVEFI